MLPVAPVAQLTPAQAHPVAEARIRPAYRAAMGKAAALAGVGRWHNLGQKISPATARMRSADSSRNVCS
jgi:hypothetical protein